MGELPVMVPDGATKPVAESLINSRTKFLKLAFLERIVAPRVGSGDTGLKSVSRRADCAPHESSGVIRDGCNLTGVWREPYRRCTTGFRSRGDLKPVHGGIV